MTGLRRCGANDAPAAFMADAAELKSLLGLGLSAYWGIGTSLLLNGACEGR